MIRRYLVALSCLTLILGAAAAGQAQQTGSLLAKVHRARQTVTLHGILQTKVLVNGKMVTSEAEMRRGPGILIISYRSGQFKGWKMIEQDGRTWHLSPAGEARAGARGDDGMGLPPVFGDLKLSITGAGRDTVAGRKVRLYQVRPPGTSQARMLMALDTATHYPLRMERYSSEGRLISATTFTWVNFKAAPPARLPVPKVAASPAGGPGRSPARVASVSEVQKAIGGNLMQPGYLPAGFVRQGTFLRTSPRGTVAEVRYGDGLRSLTMLQMTASAAGPATAGARPGSGRSGRGAQHTPAWHPGSGPSPLRGHQIRVQRGKFRVIIAGDLPADELKKVADNLK